MSETIMRPSVATASARRSSAPVLRIEGLSKRYGAVTVLDDLSLEVPAAEVLGYLGPNGAGKTTTIRLLLGLIAPRPARRDLRPGLRSDQVAMHARIAYVPGEPTCGRR